MQHAATTNIAFVLTSAFGTCKRTVQYRISTVRSNLFAPPFLSYTPNSYTGVCSWLAKNFFDSRHFSLLQPGHRKPICNEQDSPLSR